MSFQIQKPVCRPSNAEIHIWLEYPMQIRAGLTKNEKSAPISGKFYPQNGERSSTGGSTGFYPQNGERSSTGGSRPPLMSVIIGEHSAPQCGHIKGHVAHQTVCLVCYICAIFSSIFKTKQKKRNHQKTCSHTNFFKFFSFLYKLY